MTIITTTTVTIMITTMSTPRLKTVFRPLGHTEALKNGTVKLRTFEIEYVDVPVLIQAFRRMVRSAEFDICELAFTTYICAKAFGKPRRLS